MPKVSIGRYANEDRELSRIIKAGIERYGKSRKEMMIKAQVSQATYYNRLKHPEDMTLRELRMYRRELNIDDAELLSVL